MNLPTVLRFAFLAAVFALPFGTKKFLFSFATPFANFYTSEYTAAFMFAGDLFLLLVVALLFFGFRTEARGMLAERRGAGVMLGAFLWFACLSLVGADYPAFGVYALLRLFLAVGTGLAAWWAVRAHAVTVREVAAAIAASAVLQAVVATLQFLKQGSVGLRLLGETVALAPTTPGVAAIAAEGVQFLRAYGTFPHANVLAAFLALGLVALFYLFLVSDRAGIRMLAIGATVLVEAGLILTFSRSGWIVAVFAVVAALALGFMNRALRERVWTLAGATTLSLTVFIVALAPLIVPRANLAATEGPVADRWLMNKMGVALIAERPTGVGIGNQLFSAYDRGMFHEFGLTARGQWQPIHNLYLLLGSEIGVAGLAAFLALIGAVLLKVQWRTDFASGTFAVMLLSLLLFGLFDHFSWDLQAGRLMWWKVLGILLGIGTGPRRSMDRMSPSEGGDAGSIPAEGTV